MTLITLKKDLLQDGTKIQIEDWSTEYSFMPYGRTIATYPKSKTTLKGSFSPNLDETFRCAFNFKSHEEALHAYDNLITGKKVLSDYIAFLDNKEYAKCI